MRFFWFAFTVMLVVGAWFTFLVSARKVSVEEFGEVTSWLIWAFAAVVAAFRISSNKLLTCGSY